MADHISGIQRKGLVSVRAAWLSLLIDMVLTCETRHLMQINAGDPRQWTYFWWIWKKKTLALTIPALPPRVLKKGKLRTYGIWASTEKLPSRLSFGRGKNVEHVGLKISFWRNGRMNEMAELGLGLEDETEGRGRRRFGYDRLSSS